MAHCLDHAASAARLADVLAGRILDREPALIYYWIFVFVCELCIFLDMYYFDDDYDKGAPAGSGHGLPLLPLGRPPELRGNQKGGLVNINQLLRGTHHCPKQEI